MRGLFWLPVQESVCHGGKHTETTGETWRKEQEATLHQTPKAESGQEVELGYKASGPVSR